MTTLPTLWRRARFTLADLMLAVALVALVAAIVARHRQDKQNDRLDIHSLTFSLDGSRLVASFADQSVKAWKIADGAPIASLPPLKDHACDSALSPDGRTVARAYCTFPNSTKTDATLEIRDLDTGRELLRRDFSYLERFTFSSDGKRLALNTPIDTGPLAWRVIDPHDSSLPDTMVRPTAPWELDTELNCIYFRNTEAPQTSEAIYTLGLSDNLTKWDVVAGGGRQAKIQSSAEIAKEAEEAKRRANPNEPPSATFSGMTLYMLAVSPDGSRLAVGRQEAAGKDGTMIEILDAATFESLGEGPAPPGDGKYWEIAFCNAGNSLALTGASFAILDARTLKLEKQVPMLLDFCQFSAVSPDGRLIAVNDEKSIYLYDGTALRRFVDYRPSGVGVFFLAAAFGMTLVAWVVMRYRRKLQRRAMSAA